MQIANKLPKNPKILKEKQPNKEAICTRQKQFNRKLYYAIYWVVLGYTEVEYSQLCPFLNSLNDSVSSCIACLYFHNYILPY